jgi:hypothetical protein
MLSHVLIYLDSTHSKIMMLKTCIVDISTTINCTAEDLRRNQNIALSRRLENVHDMTVDEKQIIMQ